MEDTLGVIAMIPTLCVGIVLILVLMEDTLGDIALARWFSIDD